MKRCGNWAPLPLLSLLLLLLFIPEARAVVRTVQVDGSGEYPTIQAAIEAAAPFDTVLVGPGRYTWTNQGTGDKFGMIRFWLRERDDVRLVSSHGPRATILDAEGMGRIFFANGDNVAEDPVEFVIDGFTFENGYAPKIANRNEQEGGAMAMHLCYATVKNCIYRNNVGEHGGALWLGGVAGHHFIDCHFENNHAPDLVNPYAPQNLLPFGGAVLVVNSPERTTFERCWFVGNSSEYKGGGVALVNCNVELKDCVFLENSATSSSLRDGVAVYAFYPQWVGIDGAVVRGHASSPGAAVAIRSAGEFQLHRSIVAANVSGFGVKVEKVNTADPAIVLDVTCTNIDGHAPADWMGLMLPFKSTGGNTELDPAFCATSNHPLAVEPTSPMLAASHGCGVSIGNVVGDCTLVSLPEEEKPRTPAPLPESLALSAAPNPFNPRTVVHFELDRASQVTIVAYDARGRRVADLESAFYPAGKHALVWNGVDDSGRALASGVYHLHIQATGKFESTKVTLLR